MQLWSPSQQPRETDASAEGQVPCMGHSPGVGEGGLGALLMGKPQALNTLRGTLAAQRCPSLLGWEGYRWARGGYLCVCLLHYFLYV